MPKGRRKPGILPLKQRRQALRALKGKPITSFRKIDASGAHVAVRSTGKFVWKSPEDSLLSVGWKRLNRYEKALEYARKETAHYKTAASRVPVAKKAFTQMHFLISKMPALHPAKNVWEVTGYTHAHVHERVKRITPKNLKTQLGGVIDLIAKASRKDLDIDVKIENFGVNKNKKVVLLDTFPVRTRQELNEKRKDPSFLRNYGPIETRKGLLIRQLRVLKNQIINNVKPNESGNLLELFQAKIRKKFGEKTLAKIMDSRQELWE